VRWEAPLRALVEAAYGVGVTRLASIAHHEFDDRAICRVDLAGRPPATLRALAGDEREWMLGQAAALDFVEARGFRAPRVIRTAAGEPVAVHGAWTGLLLTYVEGAEAGFAPAALEALARHAAELHTLPADPAMPPSRLTPVEPLPELPDAIRVPAVARPLHRSAMETMRRMAGWRRLPAAMLHGDCWPANAVRGPDGGLTMVDWEGAGWGPPILELGYLLVGAHLGGPQLPELRPDPERIAAVMRGYAGVRRPTAEELDWLPDAVRWDIAMRASGAFTAGQERWLDDLWLRKSVSRHAASGEIARIARACLDE
jgi:Ser/Thr protein kinase RdoA (MazF antagonist)